MLKSSIYNIVVKEKKDKLVFNARNCALVKVNDIFIELLQNPNKRPTPEYDELAKQMYNVGFLVDDCVDELKVLEYEHIIAKFDRQKLTLTILPTFDCNFKCFYCFEEKKEEKLSHKEINAIKNFTLNHIDNVKTLSVCWFGGEPLLNLEPIWELSKFFIDISEQKNVEYKAIMISNGSLITEEIAVKLKKSNVKTIQITVDGEPNTHNKRRCFIDGSGTYDRVLNSIRILTKIGIKVICRINIDKTNVDGVKKLIPLLAKEKLTNFEVSFGHVLPLGTNDKWANKICYSMKDFCSIVDVYVEMLHSYDLKIPNEYPFYPKPIKNFCGACQINSYVIHPNGDLYKCYDSLDYKVGNIFSGEATNDIYKTNYNHWISYNPFNDEECRNCKVLPICMGGCPYLREKLGQKFCLKWKNDIESVIRKKYLGSK